MLGITLDAEDKECGQIWHSYTAEYIVLRDFPQYADKKLLSAIKNHTVGSQNMTVFDEIIFLADFIEKTRTYEPSVKLREFVFSNMRSGFVLENIRTLHIAVIKAIDYTVSHLEKNKNTVNSKTLLTKNALLSKI